MVWPDHFAHLSYENLVHEHLAYLCNFYLVRVT